MANNEKQSKTEERFIYDPITHEKYPCSEELFQAYYKEAGRIRKQEQYHQRCMCPRSKWWACTGDCLICEYHAPGDTLSLDEENSESNENLYNTALTDIAPMEEIIADRILLEQLFARLKELDPEADKIIAMWQEDYKISDRAIAKKLGRAQRTFADQMKRYRAELKKLCGK